MSWSPIDSKMEQYIVQNLILTEKIQEDWETQFPFKGDYSQVPSDEIQFVPEVDTLEGLNFWATENIPYKTTTFEEFDTNTGELIDSIEYPQALPNTVFFALNSMACDTDNASLYNTENDPGN